MKITKSVGNRRFTILVKGESEGGFTGRCLELHGVVSYGKTIKELKTNMEDAITLVLDICWKKQRKATNRKNQLKFR